MGRLVMGGKFQMTLEQVLIKWAAKKFDIDITTIDSVSMEHYKGLDGCDTCGLGGECEFDVSIRFKAKDSHPRHEVVYDFSQTLAELLAIT